MKKLMILAIAALSFAACRNANNSPVETSGTQTAVSADAAAITFERDIYDFGKIEQGDKVQHDFKFKNTGKSPLIITEATATCGCTVPQPPKEPIKPGAEASIKVEFNSAGKMGTQDKVITITSNANPATTTVHLVGEVLEPKGK